MAQVVGAVVGVFGVFSGILGTISFFHHDLPNQPGKGGSVLRIACGLHSGLTNAGGHVPTVLTYNEERKMIGQYGFQAGDKGPKIPEGGFNDVTVPPLYDGVAGQQATYVQIRAGNDGLCIPYLSQTWADGTQRGWLGDMGKACRQPWYYSDVIVGENHKPACTWFDGDHTNGISANAVQIYMQAFANITTSYDHDPNHYCYWPILDFRSIDSKEYPTFWPDNRQKVKRSCVSAVSTGTRLPRSERNAKAKRNPMPDHLVVSADPRHTAKSLCEAATSRGPDLVSIDEGTFCDMAEKKWYPLCAEASDTDCFDLDAQQLRSATARKRSVKYDKIRYWGQ